MTQTNRIFCLILAQRVMEKHRMDKKCMFVRLPFPSLAKFMSYFFFRSIHLATKTTLS